MQSLWRALAVAWLGGIASPMLTDDAISLDRLAKEHPAAIKPGASDADAVSARPPARVERSRPPPPIVPVESKLTAR